jgi:hypothetical protein
MPDLKLVNILKSIKATDSKLTLDQKRQFLDAMEGFNDISDYIYRDTTTLKSIVQSMALIGKITENLVNENTAEGGWWDAQTVKRDMKVVQDSIKLFDTTAKEISSLQHRLESIFVDIGQKLERYFNIKSPQEHPEEGEIESSGNEDITAEPTRKPMPKITNKPVTPVKTNPNQKIQ